MLKFQVKLTLNLTLNHFFFIFQAFYLVRNIMLCDIPIIPIQIGSVYMSYVRLGQHDA